MDFFENVSTAAIIVLRFIKNQLMSNCYQICEGCIKTRNPFKMVARVVSFTDFRAKVCQ